MIEIIFPIAPVAKGRPRFNKRGFCYTDKKTRAFESQVKVLALKAVRENKLKPPEGALDVAILFYLKKPKSSKNKFPIVKPDIDNFQKAIMDSMNGILWKDDAQVCQVTCVKLYSDLKPYIFLKINSME